MCNCVCSVTTTKVCEVFIVRSCGLIARPDTGKTWLIRKQWAGKPSHYNHDLYCLGLIQPMRKQSFQQVFAQCLGFALPWYPSCHARKTELFPVHDIAGGGEWQREATRRRKFKFVPKFESASCRGCPINVEDLPMWRWVAGEKCDKVW